MRHLALILSFTVLAACGGSSASESKADDSAGARGGDLCAVAKRLEGTDPEKQATSGDAADRVSAYLEKNCGAAA